MRQINKQEIIRAMGLDNKKAKDSFWLEKVDQYTYKIYYAIGLFNNIHYGIAQYYDVIGDGFRENSPFPNCMIIKQR